MLDCSFTMAENPLETEILDLSLISDPLKGSPAETDLKPAWMLVEIQAQG